MMDSLRLECKDGFATTTTPVVANPSRKTTVTKKPIIVGTGAAVGASTSLINNFFKPTNNNNNKHKTINYNNNCNYNIISQSTSNLSQQQQQQQQQQQPPPLFINVSQQELASIASFGIQGLNTNYVSQQPTIITTIPQPYSITTTPTSKQSTTFCTPIGSSTKLIKQTNNLNQQQNPIIIGPPNGIFLPNIATNLTSLPSTSGIISRAPSLSVNTTESAIPSSSQMLNGLNVPNAFHNQSNLKRHLVTNNNNSPQLVWNYDTGFNQHQQQNQYQQPQQKQKQRKQKRNGPLSDPVLTDNDLIKLMAVLNNPALTLTPVSNSASSCSNSYIPGEFDELYNGSGYRTVNKSLIGVKQTFKRAKSGDKNSQPPKSVSNIIHSTQNMTNQQKPTSNSFASASMSGSQVTNNPSLITKTSTRYNDKTAFRYPRLTDQAIAQSTFMSTSVKNLIMQQPTLSFNPTSDKSISKHLLQHIANHSKESTASQLPNNQDIYYQNLPTGARLSDNNMNSIAIIPNQLGQHFGAHSFESFNESQINKVSEWMDRSSAENEIELYSTDLPSTDYPLESNMEDDMCDWASDMHFSYDHLGSATLHLGHSKSLHNSLADPDDIFINRPKRIMSKIDTMVERRRKRRFEKICQQPITLSDKYVKPSNPYIDENDGDDSEHDFILDGSDENYDYADVISNQLPLENDMSKEKAEYLSNVGLLSLRAKNNLQVEQCSKRQKELRCPMENICFEDLPERTKRIFNAMVTTRGYDLQLKIGTNFRRNDLSEIEGLDRHSSRIKLTYMNLLGMAKKNRRTALYRVKTANDDGNRLQDLNNQYADISFYNQESTLMDKLRQSFRPQLMHDTDTVDSMIMCSMQPYRLTKSQYMNSLGLSNILIEMNTCQ